MSELPVLCWNDIVKALGRVQAGQAEGQSHNAGGSQREVYSGSKAQGDSPGHPDENHSRGRPDQGGLP